MGSAIWDEGKTYGKGAVIETKAWSKNMYSSVPMYLAWKVRQIHNTLVLVRTQKGSMQYCKQWKVVQVQYL